MKAWYFSTIDRKLRFGDGRDIAVGVTHRVEGTPTPCVQGLHGSTDLLDALTTAPGPVLWEVELSGVLIEHEDGDKWAASERTYLRGGVDVTDVLRAFARRCALDVAHLWACPSIVREYLETGREDIREAAQDAARDSTRAAARDSTKDAARDAARDAAQDVAQGAAWAAAWDAARATAWAAAQDAAQDAAWDAARAATRAKYKRWLMGMILIALDKEVL